MKLTVNLAGASREELIELTGQLISIIEAQETRIAELEGQQKPLDTGLKERNPPSWVKANKPGPPQEGTQEAHPRFCPAPGRANTPGGARHGQLP